MKTYSMTKSKCQLIRRALIFLMLLFCGQNASASDKLNGIAVYSALSQEQFIAALYLPQYSESPRDAILQKGSKSMEMRITADKIFPRRFKRMWVESLAINAAPKELEQNAQNVSEFSRLLRVKLRQGDILRINKTPSATTVQVNGIELGQIDDPNFFDILVRTWVGPVPISSDFKAKMLSGGRIDNDLLERYNNISPTNERTQAIADALEAEKSEEEEERIAQRPSAAKPPAPAVTQNQPQTKPEVQEPTQVATAPPPAPVSTPAPAAKPKEVAKPVAEKKPPEPSPQVAAQASSAPKEEPEPTTVAILSEDDLFDDDSILEDEDSSFDFSAEELLSQQLFFSKLTKWTSNFVQYPKKAIKNNLEGTVRITMTIRRNGRVVDVRLTEKSEHEELNRAAARAVRDASPYPAIPDEVSGDELVFTVPVVFRLR